MKDWHFKFNKYFLLFFKKLFLLFIKYASHQLNYVVLNILRKINTNFLSNFLRMGLLHCLEDQHFHNTFQHGWVFWKRKTAYLRQLSQDKNL